ncbi:MAG: fimbria/pilus outer membrane usher protein [Desulfuromonadaceae bacterium]
MFIVLIWMLFCAVRVSPPDACAAETIILSVSLNAIARGEFFLKRNETGGLLIRRADLKQIGLKAAAVPAMTVDNESYIALEDLAGVSAVLDEKHLLLNLRAGAEWVDLPTVVRDFSSPSRRYVPLAEPSAFLNYRVDYGNGNDMAATWGATGQAGLRRGNLLLLSDGYYQHAENGQQAVRLMSNLTWDRPGTVSRWVAGDLSATAGEPSGPILMGGLGYASAFAMAPGLNTYPLGEFGGVATLPSEADIYVNGILVRREHLAPGDYRFQNLPVSTGANNVEIVMRDSFGNESRNNTHFYLSDRLLTAGLHDYSYNIGFLRRNFGTASNDYGQPLLVARHMFGLNDSLTVGIGAEAGNGLGNLLPRVVFGVAQTGIVTVLGGESHDRDVGSGRTVGVGYQFQSGYFNYQLSLRHNSRGYRTLADQQTTNPTKLNSGTGISMGTPHFGTVSLSGSYLETYAGMLKRSLGMSYSRSLSKKVQFSASWNSSWGTSRESNFFAGLTFIPMNDLATSATLQTTTVSDKETLSLQKSLPAGEGIGYQATVERERARNQTIMRANPYLQVNGPYGSYTADLRGQFDEPNGRTTSSFDVSAAGAVMYAGGHIGLNRPVSGSFAVVQVEGLDDVKVMLDNQEVARTNANGMAYIPTLRSYQENLIAFDDTQIAANYKIKRYSAIITPGLFGGECVSFPVAKVQAYGGRLVSPDGVPLEYVEVVLRGMGHELAFSAQSGGEFYFENQAETTDGSGKRSEACGGGSPYRKSVVPGRYSAKIVSGGRERNFEMRLPDSEDMFVSLGDVTVTE